MSGRENLGRGRGRRALQDSKPKSDIHTFDLGINLPKGGQSSGSLTVHESKIGEPGRGFPKNEAQESLSSDVKQISLGNSGNGNGNGAPIGRGGIRGRRLIQVSDILCTKPDQKVSKKGDYGTRIQLLTNYFKLETVPDWVLYQYRVDFNVEEERLSVLRSWLGQHKDRLDSAYIFDGSMLFTSRLLVPEGKSLSLISVKEETQEPVQVEIKFIQQLSYGNSVYLQVFNILVRRCLSRLNLHLVSRNYFDPHASIQLPQYNLEIWPGYVTSIKQHENSILMCSEIAHKVMRTDSALKVLAECTKESADYRKLFQQCMIGSIVLTDYNNKTYRVDDVDFNLNPLSTFQYKNDETISYVDYYKRRYQITIRDLRQPLLISRNNAKEIRSGMSQQCLLVPELCRMTGLNSKMLENRNLMKNLADVTRIPPNIRVERLKTFNRRLMNEKQVAEDLSRWQMKLSSELISVEGREFPPENIIGGRCTYTAGLEVDWTRNMRSVPMLKNAIFECFVVICPKRLKADTENFLSNLNKAARGMDFTIPRPIVIDTRSDGPADMLEAVEMALGRYRPDLIMFTFTTDRADRYSAVKKKCYVDRGIPSQVVLARTLSSKGVMSIATKVAIQINAKIGGAPWTVNIPSEHVMVIGFDVCHDKSKKSKSVGAMVASLNQAMSAWYSSVNFHTSGEELSDSLALDVCKAIRKYREFNSNVLPNRIFIYRDGVGEGQINHVYNHEVVALKKRLTELYGGEHWKLAYIIVTKRIRTRFFNRDRNPRPGTIVDDVITLPERYDFYLVSQSVRQGTVSPTSYNVISDNLGWGPNYIQRFTYKMTHLYYNCSASVGVPAPCQYAHKLAFMVSQSLHAEPHSNLNTRLYFL